MTQNNNNSNNNNSVKFEKPAGYKNINTSTAGSKQEEKESRFSLKEICPCSILPCNAQVILSFFFLPPCLSSMMLTHLPSVLISSSR